MTSLWTAIKPTLTLRFQLPRSQFPTNNAIRLCSTTSPNSPTFRSSYSLSSGVTERLRNNANLFTVSVSNFNFTDADSPNDEAGGPPFLTIIAGLLVFAVLFWIASSIITLFFSLVSKLLFGK